MSETKLFDLTKVQVAREIRMQREGDPLADPTFARHVASVSTEDERSAVTERMLKARRSAA